MALLNLLSVFIIFILSLSALGKNVAPPAFKPRTVVQDAPRNLPRNKAPSMKVTGGASRDLEQVESKSTESAPVPQVHQDHVFYDSYQSNFSWSDPALQAALGIRPASSELNTRDNNLVKRTPGSAPGDPLIKAPSCLGCIEASNGQTVTLADLNTGYLENQILLKPDSILQDRCVFYTSVPNALAGVLNPADLIELFDRKNLGGADTHPGLSLIATNWACSTNKVTIWVSSAFQAPQNYIHICMGQRNADAFSARISTLAKTTLLVAEMCRASETTGKSTSTAVGSISSSQPTNSSLTLRICRGQWHVIVVA